MMILPETYRKMIEGESYPELMKERERLLEFMHQYEAEETAGDQSAPVWVDKPSPELRYQMYFVYLSVLCEVMHKRYSRDYAGGRRPLKQDAVAEV